VVCAGCCFGAAQPAHVAQRMLGQWHGDCFRGKVRAMMSV